MTIAGVDLSNEELIGIIEEFDEWKRILDLADYALTEIYTKFEIFNKNMDSIHRNPIEHMKRRVKKYVSIQEKLERRGYSFNTKNALEHIHDIAGLRIVCPFETDIFIVKNYIDKLEREGSVKIIEVKNYIENPKPNGYRSLHVIVSVPVKLLDTTEWFDVEIQIRTVAMDFWACLEHKILYKKTNIEDKTLSERLKKCAEMISFLDKEMYDINKSLKK